MSRPAGALAALAAGAFALGTGELGVAGLIPAIDAGLHTGPGTAGLLVSAYAIAVAVAGPPLSVALARLPSRAVLTGALAAMAAGTAGTAATDLLPVVLAARILAGASAAAYVAVALRRAGALAGPDRAGRAVAVVFGGVSAAGVLGVPACAALGGALGWRPVLLALGALTGASALAVAVALPPAAGTPRSAGRGGPPGRLVAALAGNGLVTAGHYAAATYLVTLLRRATGLDATSAAVVLVGTGLAAVAGTYAGGVAADRAARRAATGAAALVAGCLCLLPVAIGAPVPAVLLALGWSAAFAAFSTAAQTAVAGGGGAVGGAVNVSAFNVGIAAGSAAGGLALGAGVAAVAALGGGLVAAGLIVSLAARRPGAGRQRRAVESAGDAGTVGTPCDAAPDHASQQNRRSSG